MPAETARVIVRRMLTGRECGLIQFFGGEPTLNLEAVQAAIEETLTLVQRGELRNRPRFAVVTNGVFPDLNLALSLLVRYGVETTVSLDGPAPLHDSLRPLASSAPTYERVVRTISTLVDAGLPVAVESVYTARHVEDGFSLADLMLLCQQLRVSRLLVDIAHPPVPAELNPLLDPHYERLLTYYWAGIDWWFQKLLAGSEKVLRVYFRDLLLPLLDGVPAVNATHGCGAAETDLVVGPDGDLFACQLVYGHPQYRLGNVVSGEYCGMAEPFPFAAEDFDDCRRCYCRNWCQPCFAINHLTGDRWVPPKRECGLRKAVVRRIGWWAFRHLSVPNNEVTAELRSALTREAEFGNPPFTSPRPL